MELERRGCHTQGSSLKVTASLEPSSVRGLQKRRGPLCILTKLNLLGWQSDTAFRTGYHVDADP